MGTVTAGSLARQVADLAPVFARHLRQRASKHRPKRWLFIPYDQLSDQIGPLARAQEPGDLGICLVENLWQGRRRRYHRQKLALVTANMRNFALEQAARGVPVHYAFADGPYRQALAALSERLGPLSCMEPAEHELRADLGDSIATTPHEGWLSTREDFLAQRGPPWRMDAFYRRMRRKTGALMAAGSPVGGRWSLDAENRRPWPGDPPAPEPPSFSPSEVTAEACAAVDAFYPDHPGTLDPESLPATAADAERLWAWACQRCLPHFGPFEDAMSSRSRGLFHSRISPLVNIHRLLPARVVEDALAMPLPLATKEGFVRQILGWREYMRHVHRETDGLADVPTRNFFGAHDPLPAAYWGKPSGLRCLDEVVVSVWEEGYSHHITRLMILCSLAVMLEVTPDAVSDWFWVAYIDAYDWVVQTNVLGMGMFALGELMVTKPYTSGAAYIDRMSDFCRGCRFNPKKDCPITSLYWAHLGRHADRLAGNHRLAMPLRSLSRRSPSARAHDQAVAEWARKALQAGDDLRPESRPGPG